MNNLFATPGEIAADEWRARRSTDEESAEREMRQFIWCLPVVPAKLQQTSLEVHELQSRVLPLAKGLVPAAAQLVTVGLDLGKYLCHWVAVAWSPSAMGHILDYGRIEVASEDLGVEQALMVALREFREETVLPGWLHEHPVDGVNRIIPEQVWVDSGYMPEVVYAFCRGSGRTVPTRGGTGSGSAAEPVVQPADANGVDRSLHRGGVSRQLAAGGAVAIAGGG